MWTDQDIQTLRDKLKQELDAAMSRSEWVRLGNLSEALRLTDQREPDADPNKLARQIEQLVGEAVVAQVRQDITEAPVQGQVPAEGVERLIGGLAELGQSARGGTDAPPPLESVSEDRSHATVDLELQAKLEPLRDELRSLEDHEPQTLKELPSYISRLQRVTEHILEIAPQSSEARQATGDLALLREMLGLADRVRQVRREIGGARDKRDLDRARRARQEAERLLRDASAERYEQAFYTLARQLREAAEALVQEVEEARRSIAEGLGEWLTVQRANQREELEARLDELDKLFRSSVPTVQVDPRDENLIRESVATQESDGVLVAKTTEVRAAYVRGLLRICVQEAERLVGEARQYFDDDLDMARERCQTGLGFVQSQHIKNFRDVQDVVATIQGLLEEIGKQERRRDEARLWYDKATNATESLAALNSLARAEALFARLPGLKEEKDRWLDILWNYLDTGVRLALSKAGALVQEREHKQALDVLNTAQNDLFARLPSNLDAALSQHKHDLPVLRASLRSEAEKIESEHAAWLAFKPRIEQLKHIRSRVTEGQLDQVWIEEQARQFAPEDLQRFDREWQDVITNWARQAGDQTSLAIARDRFRQNPLDETIADLLSNVGATSALHEEAQRLLGRHRARVALARARQKLGDSSLVTEPKNWWKDVQQAVEAARTNATSEDTNIITEAQWVLKAAQYIHALQEELIGHAGKGEYLKAWHRIESTWQKIEDAGQQNQVEVPSPEQDPLVVDGLRWLRLDLRKRWRDARMPFVIQVLAEGQDCRKRPGVGLDDLRQAADYAEELEQHNALTEDGDGPLAECVLRLWREAAMTEMLGTELANVDESIIVALGERRNVDWPVLLRNLEGLGQHARRNGAVPRRIVEELRTVAMGFYALEQPRAEAIAYLQAQREHSSLLRTDSIMCGVLALLLLEANDLAAARNLTAELREMGRAAQSLADSLAILLNAYELHDEGDLELAIPTLEAGAAALKELAPNFAPGIDQAAHDTARRWRRALGANLVDQARKEVPTAKGLDVFAVLHKARRAEELLGADPRVTTVIGRLDSKVRQALGELHEAVQRLVGTPPHRIEEAIQQGEELNGYLTEVLGPDQKPEAGLMRSAADDRLGGLASDLDDLQEQLDRWQRGERNMTEAREQLRHLLEGDWRWNIDPRQMPNRELRDVKSRLAEVEEIFAGNSPPEVKGLQQIARTLEQAVREISEPFEQFRRGFEGDEYRNDTDFRRAREILHEIQQRTETWERLLSEQTDILYRSRSPVNLRRFFLARNIYGRARLQDGHWVAGLVEDLHSPAEASERLEDRRRNWQQWQTWVERTTELLGEIQDSLLNAERYLRGGRLGSARELCETSIPASLTDLEIQQRRVPEPPLCQLALHAARNLGAFQPDLESDAEVQRIWEALRGAARTEMPAAWRECLRLEIETARRQLGPTTEGQGDHIRTLRDTCVVQQEQLQPLSRDMDQHIRVYKKPTAASQRIYDELLAQAEKIDREDPNVRRHRNIYNQRQTQLR